MFTFRGSIQILAGEFKTLSELVATAIAARTYATAAAETDAISRFRNVTVCNVRIHTKAGTVYLIDGYKGVVNGVVTQATWAAGDFTAEPGGGIPIVNTEADRAYINRVSLSNTVIYAVANQVIYLDISSD